MVDNEQVPEHSSPARLRWLRWLRPAAGMVEWDRGRQPAAYRALGDLDPGMMATVGGVTLWLHTGVTGHMRDLPVTALVPTADDQARLVDLPREVHTGLPLWSSIHGVIQGERARWDTWVALLTAASAGSTTIGEHLDAIGYDDDSPHYDGGIARARRHRRAQ